jgi:hypothetical protein
MMLIVVHDMTEALLTEGVQYSEKIEEYQV